MFYFCSELYIVLLNFHLQSQEMCFVIALPSSFFVIISNYLTYMSFVSFGTHIFGDKTLQRPVHLSKLVMNE